MNTYNPDPNNNSDDLFSQQSFPARESTTYVNWHTVWAVLIVAVLVTAAAITYGLQAAGGGENIDVLVDRVAQQQDLTPCEDAEDKSACYARSYFLVPQEQSCARVLDLGVQETCKTYFTALEILKKTAEVKREQFTYDQVELEVTFRDGGTKNFSVVVADTDPKRVQGLSYTPSMASNEGMLFAFPGEMPEMSFHMKDMLMPLDIIYLTKDFVPVQSFRNLPSCAGAPTQGCPLLTREGGDVQYVLEVLPQGREVIGVAVLES